MKKLLRSASILLLVLFLMAQLSACSSTPTPDGGSTTPKPGEVRRFTIGTAGTAGALYPMGVAMAETISNHVEGFTATGEATAASIENLRNLHDGKMGWAISQTEVASMAYYGKADYAANPYTDIRALYSTIYNYLQVFTSANSSINSVADFKGKTIGVGAAGSGGEMAARALLDTYGLTYDDIKPQFMPEAEAVSALKDGKIDGFIATHPLKSAAMTELTTSMKARLIAIEDDAFYKANPAYTKYTVPAGTYKDIDVDVIIPRSRIIMCTSINAGFTDDEIYNMVKAIWENRAEWAISNASVEKQVNIETALEEIDIPLHPGAIKYFEEIGMTIPDALKK
ncbi:MAG: TAXI family TRAP transporter solute-binding subunit [Lutisporaceae bacterium]